MPISECDRWLPWIAEQAPTIWIIHCLKGVRSEQFAHMLEKVLPGDCAHRIYVLEGGLERWAHAGLETVKGSHTDRPFGHKDPSYREESPTQCHDRCKNETSCVYPANSCNTPSCPIPKTCQTVPSYKDIIQRKINIIVGSCVLISTYYITYANAVWAETLLWIIGIGLILNGVFAWCFLYRVLSCLCCK